MHAYIYGRAHSRAQDVAGRILGTRNRTHVPWTRCSHVHAHRLFVTKASIRYRNRSIAIYRHKPMYTHMARSTRALARTHKPSWPRTRTACPTGDPYGRRRSINTRTWLYIDHAVTWTELPELSVCSALRSLQHEPAAACERTANMCIYMPLLCIPISMVACP